ncbi:zinc finger protein 148-like [Octopus sinensis]|uniref:Zinc finger protein 148-like n=1 Tax=Octopus sinensis TaxID=2607531 RepID=A0A6P7TTT1_9MOLL|nr:zinc finger protein 148-like [Octopus sinensis]
MYRTCVQPVLTYGYEGWFDTEKSDYLVEQLKKTRRFALKLAYGVQLDERLEDSQKSSVLIIRMVLKKMSVINDSESFEKHESPQKNEFTQKDVFRDKDISPHLNQNSVPRKHDIINILGLAEKQSQEMNTTPEKPPIKNFLCTWCNQKFKQKIHLQKHEYKHTGDKPYKCLECDYSTVERSHLKVHIRIHTGNYFLHCRRKTI